MALFAWAASQYGRWPQLRLMFHIQNASANKSARVVGVKAGVPDIFLPVPKPRWIVNDGGSWQWYHGLFIELKRHGGKVSPEQIDYGSALVGQGYKWEVCYGWEMARDAIVAYLSQ